jgi:hypothetical protein
MNHSMPRPTPDPLELIRIPPEAVAPAVAQALLRLQAKALLRPEQTARQYVEALLRESMYLEAITFLAFALPRREGVWWASLFLLWTGAGKLHPQDARRLQAVVRWVVEPSEARRKEVSELEDPGSPAGLLAQAVKRTGGSMLGPKYPVRPPAPELAPRGLVMAINAAVMQGEAKTLAQRQKQAVALGMHIARGRYPWQANTAVRHTTGS